ncbi:MAG: FecR family protein [Gammaproteobacteria bacterium]|nr:FecR family protein [Gammaproteobacteria bacterium]MDH5303128.1 FecR family protein [Gammaproteobacteria bacterium]MDH5323029.1 FecR family protein [Gammaproteobacteria bacterium]
MNKRKLQLWLILVLVVTGPVYAQDAGMVSFASGDVSAEREPAVALAKGDAVRSSDAVITGPASRAQLLMSDGARIAIRPDSRIVIDEYVYAAATSGAAAVSSSDDSSVISLVKGGFRSITGAIGKDNPQNYEVRTAVGVLGIRGTNFAVLLCGNCNTAPGVPPGTVVPQGLYIMVDEGRIVFRNEVGEIEVGAGEFVFIPFDSRQPTRLEVVPPVFIDDSDFRFEPDLESLSGFDSKLGPRREAGASAPPPISTAPASSTQDDGSNIAVPAQSIRGTDAAGNPVDLTPGAAPDPSNRSVTFSTGPLGGPNAIFSGMLDNDPGQYQLDSDGNLVQFANLYPAPTGLDTASFAIGSATLAESGADSMTVMRWGRWAGGTASISLSDGSAANQDLRGQSVHWIAGPAWSTSTAMPISGVANYSLVGSTSPTDNLGNVGALGNATFRADFTNMRVDSTLLIDINGASWSASGNGNIGAAAQLPAHLFQGIYGNVAIDGVTGGNGVFSGFFAEPGPSSDPAFPGGAGLTYSLQDMAGSTSVSGAAVFGNP